MTFKRRKPANTVMPANAAMPANAGMPANTAMPMCCETKMHTRKYG